MPPYSRDEFEPPAPAALVEVRNRTTGQSVANVPMLIDTGADVTLVPQAVLDRLQLTPVGETVYELTGLSGERHVVNAVQLDVIFRRKTFRGLYLPIDHPWGILGRNILNALDLRLNGPQLTWDEGKAFT